MNKPSSELRDSINHQTAEPPTRKPMNTTAETPTANTGAMSAADLSSHTGTGRDRRHRDSG